jgi:hypothetical protein
MNRYINRTYRFIARETKCIRDAKTAAVCRIAYAPPATYADLEILAATDPFAADDLEGYNDVDDWRYQRLVGPLAVPIHPAILDIDEIKWHILPWKLTKVSVTKWQINPKWEQICSIPTECATDYQNNYLAFNYRGSNTDNLRMIVRRLPLVNLIADADVPEFRTHYHDYFVNGVLWQMYSKQDAPAADLVKAADYKAAFDKDIDEIKQQEIILHQKLNVNQSHPAFR